MDIFPSTDSRVALSFAPVPKEAKLTPMMAQYRQCKGQLPAGTILLFRLLWHRSEIKRHTGIGRGEDIHNPIHILLAKRLANGKELECPRSVNRLFAWPSAMKLRITLSITAEKVANFSSLQCRGVSGFLESCLMYSNPPLKPCRT